MDYMLGQGTTLFLEASEEKIVSRLIENSSRRPLMSGKKPGESRRGGPEDRNQISDTVTKFLELYTYEVI